MATDVKTEQPTHASAPRHPFAGVDLLEMLGRIGEHRAAFGTLVQMQHDRFARGAELETGEKARELVVRETTHDPATQQDLFDRAARSGTVAMNLESRCSNLRRTDGASQ